MVKVKMSATISNKFKRIKLLLLDFYGVMTDGFVYVDENGKESVRCSRRDGMGIKMMKSAGIEVGVISKEINPVVTARCHKLGIACFQRISDGKGKRRIIETLAKEKSLSLDQIAFIGDDVQDIEGLSIIGLPIAVSDAHPKIFPYVKYITKRKGGDHAVREVTDLILESQGVKLTY